HAKIFMDRVELEPGMAWQQKIFDSLVSCRKIMPLYSPDYLSSKACQEEFNIAQLLHLKKKDVLFPVYLLNADPLPQYMTFWQYIDCREADKDKLEHACEVVLRYLYR
ncbi:MAG: toll/interleukin-1 receptor domain-containing protein, partial [Desulfomonilia bacterium]|nr:toll/interleukin-1 receptor domain-containing protein [Desulfomonilia bacterium]